MDDVGSAAPQIVECIGGLLPQTTRKLKQPKKRVWLPTSARMIAAREDHIKPSFPSDGFVRLIQDIMSGLGHIVPPRITRSAVRTLQVCSEDFLVEVFTAWTRSSKRAELTEDDDETFKDIVRRLQDYTLLKSKRVSDNHNKGCPSAPSTLCRDSTPDRRVFSEPRTLKRERRERKLLRRAGFLCNLARTDADHRDEQLKGAKQPTECAYSGQLTCCPHGLPRETREDKDGNIQRTKDCSCSDKEMSGSHATSILGSVKNADKSSGGSGARAPNTGRCEDNCDTVSNMLSKGTAPEQRSDDTNGETSTSSVNNPTQRIETSGAIQSDRSAQKNAPAYLRMHYRPSPGDIDIYFEIDSHESEAKAKSPRHDKQIQNSGCDNTRGQIGLGPEIFTDPPLSKSQRDWWRVGPPPEMFKHTTPPRESVEDAVQETTTMDPKDALASQYRPDGDRMCLEDNTSDEKEHVPEPWEFPPRPMSPYEGHFQEQLDTIEMSVAVEALEHQPDSNWQGPNPSRNNDLPDVLLQSDRLQITTYPDHRNFKGFVLQENDTEHHCSKDTSLPSAIAEDADKYENEEAATRTTTMIQSPYTEVEDSDVCNHGMQVDAGHSIGATQTLSDFGSHNIKAEDEDLSDEDTPEIEFYINDLEEETWE